MTVTPKYNILIFVSDVATERCEMNFTEGTIKICNLRTKDKTFKLQYNYIFFLFNALWLG